ncbi:MAG: heavy metal translocating P-type ATPase metal-binding domain-containing protein [Ardenticatenales bacterium]
MIPSTARLASAAADAGGTPLNLCLHCGSPVPSSRSDGYCCAGCMAVRRLLGDAGLDGYYALRPARIRPLLDYFERQSSLEWLDGDPGAASGRLDLAVEGIQCAACVWAIEKLARRDGLARLGVNSALGQLSLRFDPARFDVRAYLEALADFGYRVRPAADASARADPSRGLLLRLGVCAAITLNTMSFSLPFYLGLAEGAGALQSWLRGLSVLLTTVAVGYGGSYFFGRAWRSARHGIAHFDIPVAIGILAAYAGSLWALAEGRTDALYLDSVNVFLTFMLLGRFLQERTLQRNRRQLLRSDAFGLAMVTALDPRAHDIPWREVRPGTRLLLQPGSLCPAEATLRSRHALEFDLASLTGERAPATVPPGGPVRAGARLVSNQPAHVDARAGFDASALAALLPQGRGPEELPVLWRWSVQVYVFVVLTAALAGLVGWWPTDPHRAAQVFISVLVVTCPCGLGIAVPLARTLADQRLARGGVTVRQPGVLDRLLTVRQVWLDKTGTLTLADLELKDDGAIDALDDAARRALMGAAGASRHPVSRALFHELTARGVPYPDDGDATEIPGQGVRFVDGAGDWFLGRTMAPDGAARAELRRDGRPVAAFHLTERVLMDGAASVERLRSLGLGVGLLSGDAPARVAAMADQLGLRTGEARGDLSPADKARAVALAPSLMLGDGLNDSLALQRAVVSGSPAWERSALADESDLSFASGSLAWLPELFGTARTLHRVMWGNLFFAWGYNGLLIALALSGRFSPLLCAVTMPASSLVVSAATTRALRR